MSQNINNPSNKPGGSTGAGESGNKSDHGTGGGTGAPGNPGTTGGTGLQTGGGTTATATAPAREGLAGTAQEYGQKIADAASTAKDYVSDKVSVVGDKFKDLQNTDFNQVSADAKAYARENPGQALLISAAAGFLLGLLLRSGRR